MEALWGYCLYLLNKACSIGIHAAVKSLKYLVMMCLVIVDGMLVLCNKWAKQDGEPQTQINYMTIKANRHVIWQPTKYILHLIAFKKIHACFYFLHLDDITLKWNYSMS